MKKIAIIGASYLQEPLVRKAKEMGLYTICFAWADGATCAEICDRFYDISIVEKEQILQICEQEHIDGICTIASDVAAPTVAYVANRMGLVGNDYKAALCANNKFLMREAFTRSGVDCPQYMMVTPDTWNTPAVLESLRLLAYPLIVKPSDRSGSLGVTKVERPDDLGPAIEKALSVSFKHEAMIEEYIEGREISVEFISYQGRHYPLQITDKVTTEAPHFVELEHHQPADLPAEKFAEIYAITARALDALGLTNGASHSEYKITSEDRVVVMEIGGRMGGDFIGSDLVRLSTGYDFVRGVIEVALGDFEEPLTPTPHPSSLNHSGVYFLCEETRHLLPIISNRKSNPAFVAGEITDQELHKVEKSADRSGYVIYQAESKIAFD